MTEREDEIRERLGRWTKAYHRLTKGGLHTIVHTAGVHEFFDADEQAPYVAVADIEWLLAEVERLRSLADLIRKGYEANEQMRKDAEAEAATLREVVQRVAERLDDPGPTDHGIGCQTYYGAACDCAWAELTAALGDAPEGDGGGVS